MTRGLAVDDPLDRWLSTDVVKALETLTAEALDVIAVIDRELRIRYINWTGSNIARDQVLGGSVITVSPPGYQETTREAFAKVLETGVGTFYETMYGEGENVHIWEVRLGPIRFDDEVIGVVAITSNVTEQRRKSADRDRFFQLSLDMLVVVSPDGKFKRVNPAFASTLGYRADELEGKPFVDFMHPDDHERTEEAFRIVLGGTPVADFENRYPRADGEYRVFSWRGTVDPVTRDVYAVARDVTEHRETETQLKHAQKMDAVGQLAGGVAHDFNNLMLAVLGNAELAAAALPQGSEAALLVDEIAAAGRRAADLTKQLLAFSRRQPLRPALVDLNELTEGLMNMLKRLLPENISVTWVPGHALASVSGDSSQLEQVIVNLCVNARDAMERGGHLTIETQNTHIDARYRESHPWVESGQAVLLRVADTGVGMSAEVRERAFEPFFTTKGTHQGTGLGLSTVYGIVRQHGGMIQCRSEPDEGTVFEVFLPADTRPVPGTRDTKGSAPPRGQETILLAEDEEPVRKVLVHMLEDAGYRTLEAANGADAIRLLRDSREPIDLALLDVVMPELGGPETWEQMRGLREGLRVLFTSGYADNRYLTRLPPDAEVLEKPFRMERLLKMIRKKLDE